MGPSFFRNCGGILREHLGCGWPSFPAVALALPAVGTCVYFSVLSLPRCWRSRGLSLTGRQDPGWAVEAGGGAQLGAPGSWTVKLAQEEKGYAELTQRVRGRARAQLCVHSSHRPTPDLGLVLQTQSCPSQVVARGSHEFKGSSCSGRLPPPPRNPSSFGEHTVGGQLTSSSRACRPGQQGLNIPGRRRYTAYLRTVCDAAICRWSRSW